MDRTGDSVRSLPRNPREVEIFDRPDDNQYVPALGSLDLLRLAIWSEIHHYTVLGIELRDRSMSPISERALEPAEESIIKAIRNRDLAGARSALRNGERSPYTLVAIEIANNQMHDIKVARAGEIEADPEADVMQFVAPAWSDLHLS